MSFVLLASDPIRNDNRVDRYNHLQNANSNRKYGIHEHETLLHSESSSMFPVLLVITEGKGFLFP